LGLRRSGPGGPGPTSTGGCIKVGGISAEEFVERARVAGFRVEFWATAGSFGGAINLARKLHKEEAQPNWDAIRTEVERLFVGVPKTALFPGTADQGLRVDLEELRAGEISVTLEEVDHTILVQLEEMGGKIKRSNKSLEEQEEFGFSFDEKVDDEIFNDPEVEAMTQELEIVRERERKLALDLEAKKNELRQQRQVYRKPFLYVVDEREV
jgi:hypothetical protein